MKFREGHPNWKPRLSHDENVEYRKLRNLGFLSCTNTEQDRLEQLTKKANGEA